MLKFNMTELSGSLGDLGTFLPLAIGLIVINGIDPTNLLFMGGAFYILSGLYFGVVVPVQPMKVIAAYAIAMQMTQHQITASALGMGILLIFLGATGIIKTLGNYIPKSVVRGVQFGVGALLIVQGIKFVVGPDASFGIAGFNFILGGVGALTAYLLLDNKRIPASVVLVLGGILIGAAVGKSEIDVVKFGLYLPRIFPYGMPGSADVLTALPLLVLPQLPTTIGNAVISSSDLAKYYFGEKAKKVSLRAFASSQGLANLGSFIFGGMPMCHGAGGLAAHYRFGARTAGANLIIGTIFLSLAILLGSSAVAVLRLLPSPILGVLLIFAGVELAKMISDLKEKKDFFVVLAMLAIAITVNLGAAFIAGVAMAYALKKLFTATRRTPPQ